MYHLLINGWDRGAECDTADTTQDGNQDDEWIESIIPLSRGWVDSITDRNAHTYIDKLRREAGRKNAFESYPNPYYPIDRYWHTMIDRSVARREAFSMDLWDWLHILLYLISIHLQDNTNRGVRRGKQYTRRVLDINKAMSTQQTYKELLAINIRLRTSHKLYTNVLHSA